MDSDDKLRQEIAQLSSLIASRQGRKTSPPTSFNTPQSGGNLGPHFHRSRDSRTIVNNGKLAFCNRFHVPQYPNPFRYSVTKSYVQQAFSSQQTSKTKISENDALNRISASNSRPSLYKLSAKQNSYPSQHSASTKVTCDSTLNLAANATKEELILSTFGSIPSTSKVRPHINPAHSAFQFIKRNLPSTVPVDKPPLTKSIGVGGLVCDNIRIVANDAGRTSVINPNPPVNISVQAVNSTISIGQPQNLCSVKTKYKLDRRLKRSPIQKSTYRMRRISDINQGTIQKTKLFKRYSMRLVCKSRPSLNKNVYQYFVKKSIASAQRQLSKTHVKKSYFKLNRTSSLIMQPDIQDKLKAIVHIDGNKFIRKNGGKSLKRLKSRNSGVVNINGHKFISKNGGKTLNRVKDISCHSKKIIHSQAQNAGLRLASRAVAKSKFTLSQRVWRKKQFCVFYIRFGECRRNENNSCPYIHDRKQLMICPKFIGGKCVEANCKLSHDLKLGRMPPCQFFNQSKCSRQNCPFPHVKSSPVPQKSTKTIKGSPDSTEVKPNPNTPRKRKISIRSIKVSPKRKKAKSVSSHKKDKKQENKSRYYEQSPDSQPVVSIIPRRLPIGTAKTSVSELQPSEAANKVTDTGVTNMDGNVINGGFQSNASCSNALQMSDAKTAHESKRMRLMNKVLRLKERVKKKESEAPHFLAFN